MIVDQPLIWLSVKELITTNRLTDYHSCFAWLKIGASVAQWSERSPFTSEVSGSILRENFLNVTRTQCSLHVKRVSQHFAESRGFSPGAPVSSHKEVDRVG